MCWKGPSRPYSSNLPLLWTQTHSRFLEHEVYQFSSIPGFLKFHSTLVKHVKGWEIYWETCSSVSLIGCKKTPTSQLKKTMKVYLVFFFFCISFRTRWCLHVPFFSHFKTVVLAGLPHRMPTLAFLLRQ